MKQYKDIDFIPFLEEKMKENTKHYQEDFEIDKSLFLKAATSIRPDDKVLLWLSRPNGTQCVKEHDAFVRDTAAHKTWRFYAEQTADPIVAYAVEVIGKREGVLYGNVFELNYRAHAAEVADKAVSILEYEKTFADGFISRVSVKGERNELYELTADHGSVTDSFAIPKDGDMLSEVLSDQRTKRHSLKMAEYVAPLRPLSANAQLEYNEIKHRHPEAIVCFAQHGNFEIYGEDAKRAAPVLKSKLLKKELEGGGQVAVTGFPEGRWVAASKKLLLAGQDVFLTKANEHGLHETVKDLRADEFIPVGLVVPMDGRTARIEAVDFASDKVTFTDITDKAHPKLFYEPVAYVRSYIEDMSVVDLPDRKEKAQKPKSVMAKLRACEKVSQEREAAKPRKTEKTKEMEM